jgi:hypothetical protein
VWTGATKGRVKSVSAREGPFEFGRDAVACPRLVPDVCDIGADYTRYLEASLTGIRLNITSCIEILDGFSW